MPTIGLFITSDGLPVPAVNAKEMRLIDEIATGEFGLGILQMMENAGRALTEQAMNMLTSPSDTVVVFAGSGGNGGGGLCAARHLLNRGFSVVVALGGPVEALRGAAFAQWRMLEASGVRLAGPDTIQRAIRGGALVIDALVGYGLRGPLRGRIADLVSLCEDRADRVLSFDVPSGWDATSGNQGSLAVNPQRILTLALPKTGLAKVEARIYLADLGIPVCWSQPRVA
jgi:NAD(P)H-hydrate epimerase